MVKLLVFLQIKPTQIEYHKNMQTKTVAFTDEEFLVGYSFYQGSCLFFIYLFF